MGNPNRCWEGGRRVMAECLLLHFLSFGVTLNLGTPWPKALPEVALSFQHSPSRFWKLLLSFSFHAEGNNPWDTTLFPAVSLTLPSPNKMAHFIRPTSNYLNWMGHLFQLGLILSCYKICSLRCTNIFQTKLYHVQIWTCPVSYCLRVLNKHF